MDFKDLLSFYFERSNASNSLWGFYITVVLGLLAYFGTASLPQKKFMFATIIAIGFIGFAYTNEKAIMEVATARLATATLIREYHDPDSAKQAQIDEFKKTINPSPIAGIRLFHFGSDITVLIGLWYLTLRK